MELHVELDNDLLPDKYAKYAPIDYRTNDMPTVKFSSNNHRYYRQELNHYQ